MNKLDDAYKSIGEVAKILDLVDEKNGSLKTHTIRFWEKEFKQIKPKIFSGNRRYYDSKLIELLKNIKYLLKEKDEESVVNAYGNFITELLSRSELKNWIKDNI